MELVRKFTTSEEAVDYALWSLAHMARYGRSKVAKKEGFAVSANAKDAYKRPIVVFDIDATLVRNDSSAIEPTIRLLQRLRNANARIHLVTARHPSMRDETVKELAGVGVTSDLYDSLMITPPEARTDMGAVGRWKEAARRKIAIAASAPVAITIGDQWTDLLSVKSAEELNELDAAYVGFGNCPKYILLRLRDGVATLGLKLAYEEEEKEERG